MKIVIQAHRPEFLPATLHFLDKFWPKHPEVVVITWPPHRPNVKVPVVYLGRDRNYASNMIEFFDRHYREKYFIHLHEDYVLRHPVDQSVFQAAVKLIQHPNVCCVRLSKRWTPQNAPSLKEDKRFRVLRKGQHYCFSHQVAMWQASVYRGLLRHRETAWQTETRGTTRTRNVKQTFLGVAVECIDYHNLYARKHFDQGALRDIRRDLPNFLKGAR